MADRTASPPETENGKATKATEPATQVFLSNKGRQTTAQDLHSAVDMLALSYYYTRAYKAQNPVALGQEMYQLFKRDSMVNRTINQYTEQAFADAYIRPMMFNSVVQRELDAFWRNEKWHRKIWRGYKQYAICGEQWVFMPLRRNRTVGGRILVPWQISNLRAYEVEDWIEADYGGGVLTEIEKDTPMKLKPWNTAYFAHDAMFDSLRGMSPFVSLYFAVDRYNRWLDARERLVRVASNVVGHMHFASMEDAGKSLGWDTDASGNFIPKEVSLPNEGTIAITVGEAAEFKVVVPQVHSGDAEADGRAFYNHANEATRLPEYFSGDGRQVNVATAKVQYPIAIRSILSLRDFYNEALIEMVRVLLRRLVKVGVLPEQWTATMPDKTTVQETPETATIEFTWPEIRELDFEDLFNSFTWLYQQGLLDGDWLLQYFGYDPDIVRPEKPPDPVNTNDSTTPTEPSEPTEPDDPESRTAKFAELREALKQFEFERTH